MEKKMDKEKTSTSIEVQAKTNEGIVPQPEKDFNIQALIAQALEQKTPIETLERLLAMRNQLKSEWAKEQYDRAMAQFQSECPIIKKTKEGGKTNSGQVAYYYAPLEEIVRQTKEAIGKNGLSYSIKSETLPEGVSVTVFVKHQAGHSESSNITIPLGTKTQVMSAPQVVAAAITFASRYAFKNAFGIMTGDDDIDGQTDKIKTPSANSSEAAKNKDYLCAEHGATVVLRPAGKTKQGTPYKAFYACNERVNNSFCKAGLVDIDHNPIRHNPETGEMEIIRGDYLV